MCDWTEKEGGGHPFPFFVDWGMKTNQGEGSGGGVVAQFAAALRNSGQPLRGLRASKPLHSGVDIA